MNDFMGNVHQQEHGQSAESESMTGPFKEYVSEDYKGNNESDSKHSHTCIIAPYTENVK